MVDFIGVSSNRPRVPDDADFALYIDFQKGVGKPNRVFRAADEAIKALERLDKALCASVDNNIEPIMVLEEIEAGSLKIWLRNILHATDDQALKDLDWKPAIGKYLVRAKYAYIKWANKAEGSGSLMDLTKELKSIAEETDVKYLPDYAPPSTQELVVVAQELDSAKKELDPGDRMQFISDDHAPVEFDLKVRWAPLALEEMTVKETTRFDNMDMNLIVKKPDYLGASKWDFRHGSKSISATMADEAWLRDFHRRRFDIRPGDALRCRVTVEYFYGFDNELVRESYTVTTVESVLIEEKWQQEPLIPPTDDNDI